jgi:predicted CoA-binding protein
LRNKGYRVFAVNPGCKEVQNEPCYAALSELPEPVDAALIVVRRDKTEEVVREAAAAGIRRIWMQQGAESPEAVRFCEAHDISVVAGKCVLMHARPNGIHKFHRWLWGVLRKLPS